MEIQGATCINEECEGMPASEDGSISEDGVVSFPRSSQNKSSVAETCEEELDYENDIFFGDEDGRNALVST